MDVKEVSLNNKIIKTLLKLKLLCDRVYVSIKGIDSYTLVSTEIKFSEKFNKYFFNVVDIEEDVLKPIWIPQDYIVGLEGMTIASYIKAYNIDEEGRLSQISIKSQTDCIKDIIGKDSYNYDGTEFYNGLRVELLADCNKEYNGQMLVVKGMGTPTGIQLKHYRGRRRTSWIGFGQNYVNLEVSGQQDQRKYL